MTEIILHKQIGDDGLVYFDLKSGDLPDHFLGLAMDIQFSGDFQAAGYRGMQWGEVIAALPANKQPINMVKAFPEQGKVVAGITFKAGDLPAVSDGVLARFVFERDLVIAESFQNQVLSVYDGARRDVAGVMWRVEEQVMTKDALGGDLTVAGVSVQGAGGGAKRESPGALFPEKAVESLMQTNITDQEYLGALNYRVENADFAWGWMVILLFVLGISLGGWFWAKGVWKERGNRGVGEADFA